VQAVAKRYDGSFVAADATGASAKLPAVRYWGIWNEPNIGGWMTPQWNTLKGGKKVEASVKPLPTEPGTRATAPAWTH
jgi:hypothetical protein